MNRVFRHSAQSLASVNTVLPQYTPIDNEISSSLQIDSDVPTVADASIPGSSRLSVSSSSLSLPRYSTILSARPLDPEATEESVTADGLGGHQFEYAFPIRPHKPWCSLYLYTQDSIAGNLNISPLKPKMPRFWGGQAMTGMLAIDSESSQTIQQITMRVSSVA